MKLAITILFVAVATLGWRLYGLTVQFQSVRLELLKLNAARSEENRIGKFRLTEKCAKQAKSVFNSLGYQDTPDGYAGDTYQSHYNKLAGKCFVAITRAFSSDGTIDRVLLDAFEQRKYAEYRWHPDPNSWSDVPPNICRLIETSSNEKTCNSTAEYDAFVLKYVE